MKNWKFYMMAAIGLAGTICCASGQDDTNSPSSDIASSFYRAQEFSIDAFGSGTLGESTIDHLSANRVDHDARLGLGAGANYFFTRYIGIGGDAYAENTTQIFVDSASGNLIARLPIYDTGLAPYIFGGAGHQFEQVSQTFGQAGGGIEFRFARHLGLFVDARYVFADKTDDYGVGRVGLRVNF